MNQIGNLLVLIHFLNLMKMSSFILTDLMINSLHLMSQYNWFGQFIYVTVQFSQILAAFDLFADLSCYSDR